MDFSLVPGFGNYSRSGSRLCPKHCAGTSLCAELLEHAPVSTLGLALAAPGLKIIQLQVIFYEHLPKKENNVFPMNAVFLALSVFVVIGRFSLFR